MKTYTLPYARARDPSEHQYPDRTAMRPASTRPMEFDMVCKVWPSRAALAETIKMQQKREPRPDDWRPIVAFRHYLEY